MIDTKPQIGEDQRTPGRQATLKSACDRIPRKGGQAGFDSGKSLGCQKEHRKIKPLLPPVSEMGLRDKPKNIRCNALPLLI